MKLCTDRRMSALQASSGSQVRPPAGQPVAAGMPAASRSVSSTTTGPLLTRTGCRSTSLSGPGQMSKLSVSPLKTHLPQQTPSVTAVTL